MSLLRFNLRIRMILSIVSVLFLGLALLTGYSFWESSKLIKSEAFARSEEMAEKYSREIGGKFDEMFAVSRTMASMFLTARDQGTVDRKTLLKTLESIIKPEPLLHGIGAYFEPNALDGQDARHKGQFGADDSGRFKYWLNRKPDGSINVSALPEKDLESPGAGDWYLIPRKEMKETIIEPYEYVFEGEKIVITTPTVPIVAGGKFIGIASLDIKTASIENLIKSVRPFNSGYAALISSTATYIAHPEHGFFGQDAKKDLTDTAAVAALEKGQKWSGEMKDATTGSKIFVALYPIHLGKSEKTWTLKVVAPIDQVLAGTRELAYMQTGISIFVLVGVSLLIALIATGINRPLSSANRGVGEASSTLGMSAQRLLEIAHSLASSSQQQSAALVETSTAMQEISAMATNNAEAAKSSQQAADDSQSAAQMGMEAAKNITHAMDEIRRSSEEVINHTRASNAEFTEIIRIIESISEKTRVINDIVFQTKLLSFNASVEAARAGEAGKGFSVVAEEIGTLAVTSGTAAKDINSLLEESTQRVNDIVTRSQSTIERLVVDSKEKIDQGGVRVQECSAALEQIVRSSEMVASLVGKIASASDEQSKGVTEVAAALNELESQAQQAADMAKDSSESAGQINKEADHLKVIATDLSTVLEGQKPESMQESGSAGSSEKLAA